MSQSPLENLSRENDLPVAPIVFHQVDEYPNFKAEFALTDGDIVFHFFMSDATKELLFSKRREMWEDLFPEQLQHTAREAFRADYPRLKAQHVREFEIDSWWLRAYGFAHVPDPRALVQRFLAGLDTALETKKAT